MRMLIASGLLLAAMAGQAATGDEVLTDVEAIREFAREAIQRENDERPFRGISSRRLRAALNQQTLQLETLWREYDRVDDQLDEMLGMLAVSGQQDAGSLVALRAQKRRIRDLIRLTQSHITSLDYEFKRAVD